MNAEHVFQIISQIKSCILSGNLYKAENNSYFWIIIAIGVIISIITNLFRKRKNLKGNFSQKLQGLSNAAQQKINEAKNLSEQGNFSLQTLFQSSGQGQPIDKMLTAAFQAFNNKDYQRAQNLLKAYIGLNPDDVKALFYYGLTLGILGQHENALQQLLLVEKKDPNYISLMYYIGIEYYKLSNYNMATKYLNKYMLKGKKDPVLLQYAKEIIAKIKPSASSYRKSRQEVSPASVPETSYEQTTSYSSDYSRSSSSSYSSDALSHHDSSSSNLDPINVRNRINSLKKNINSSDNMTIESAIKEMVELGEEGQREILRIIKFSSSSQKEKFLEVLNHGTDRAIIKVLVSAMDDFSLKDSACEMLKHKKPHIVAEEIAPLYNKRRMHSFINEILQSFGPRVIPELSKYIVSENTDIREGIAGILRDFNTPEARIELEKMKDDSSYVVKRIVNDALR